MYIAFYKVDNSMGYERHTFDHIYDKPKEIFKMLKKLDEDEWKLYEMSVGYDTKMPSLDDFEEDYNNEELDGGWWCVLICER